MKKLFLQLLVVSAFAGTQIDAMVQGYQKPQNPVINIDQSIKSSPNGCVYLKVNNGITVIEMQPGYAINPQNYLNGSGYLLISSDKNFNGSSSVLQIISNITSGEPPLWAITVNSCSVTTDFNNNTTISSQSKPIQIVQTTINNVSISWNSNTQKLAAK